MFETTRPGDVLDEVRAFGFADEPVHECGAARIDTVWRTPTGHRYTSTPPPVLAGRDLGHLRQ